MSSIDVTCPELTDPANGMVAIPSRIYNSVATYSCNEGFTRIGNEMRTCQDNAMWTGNGDVTCQSKYDVNR